MRPLKARFLLVALAAFISISFATVVYAERPTTLVTAPSGTFKGEVIEVNETKAQVFLGIPFAESTSDENRWMAPVPKKRRAQVFNATVYGDICPQNYATPGLKVSEDCLNLNIWTPETAKKGTDLPVMLYIYGGSFVGGENSSPWYDGAYLAASRDVIVVSNNYRVGIFGFLATEELDGNYGFLDQQLGMQWVKDNIAEFGGDPLNITLFGESAGAISVGLHLFSAPGSSDLFTRGIMESNPLGLPIKKLESARSEGELLFRYSDVQNLSDLRKSSWKEVLKVQESFDDWSSTYQFGLEYVLPWSPVSDGKVLQHEPVLANFNGSPKPFIIGTNKNEGYLFIEFIKDAMGTDTISIPSYLSGISPQFGGRTAKTYDNYHDTRGTDQGWAWGDLMTDRFFRVGEQNLLRNSSVPRWAYQFDHQPSFPVWGHTMCREPGNVCHGDEIPFVFHTTPPDRAFTPREVALSNQIIDYWTNFAKTGNPNSPSLPEWPQYSRETDKIMVLDIESHVEQYPYIEIVDIWSSAEGAPAQ